jgi:hypothetical protein
MIQIFKSKEKKWEAVEKAIRAYPIESWSKLSIFAGANFTPSRMLLNEFTYEVNGMDVAYFQFRSILYYSNALEIGAFSFEKEAQKRGLDVHILKGLYEFCSRCLRVDEIRFIPFNKGSSFKQLDQLDKKLHQGMLTRDTLEGEEAFIWLVDK